MTYFAAHDQTGRVTGYYPPARKPEGAHVELTDEEWQAAIQLADAHVVGGAIVSIPATVPIAELKLRRKLAIDAEAERQRLRWITPGAGQAMTYQAKVEEARALAVEGEEADPSHYPMLSAEIGITGATLQDVAGVVIAAYQQWQTIGAAIEAARLGGKRAVDLAETVEDVAAIEVNWPDP